MGNFKINLDREKLTKDYIESKQNFESVLTTLKSTKSTIFKNGWFYGTVGFAGFATIMGFNVLLFNDEADDKNATLNSEQTNALDLDKTIELAQSSISFGDKMELQNEFFEKTAETTKTESIQATKPVIQTELVNQKKAELPVVNEKTTLPVEKEVAKNPATFIKNNGKNNTPSIAGVFHGDIAWEKFTQGEITLSEGFVVKQFSLYYASRAGDKTVTVDGAKVPQNILKEIESIGLNQTIFITNIIAENNENELIRCLSMDMNLKFK